MDKEAAVASRLTPAQARAFMQKLRRRTPVPPNADPTQWRSQYARRPIWRRRTLRGGTENRILLMNVAAVLMQRCARGFMLRASVGGAATAASQSRVPAACRKTATAMVVRRTNRKPAVAAAGAAAAAGGRAQSTELSLVARFLEAKVRRGGGGDDISFNDYILLRLQAWARI